MRDAVTWIIHPTQAQVMLKTLGVWRERKKKVVIMESLHKATLCEFTTTVKIIFSQKYVGSNAITANIALKKKISSRYRKGRAKSTNNVTDGVCNNHLVDGCPQPSDFVVVFPDK